MVLGRVRSKKQDKGNSRPAQLAAVKVNTNDNAPSQSNPYLRASWLGIHTAPTLFEANGSKLRTGSTLNIPGSIGTVKRGNRGGDE